MFPQTKLLYVNYYLFFFGVSTSKTIICFIAMQTYKELIKYITFDKILPHVDWRYRNFNLKRLMKKNDCLM
jgi:hypothetical protein